MLLLPFAVSGDAFLAGTLEVSLLDDFLPALGDSFTILETEDGDVRGIFEEVLLPSLDGSMFELTYNEQSVVLEIVESEVLTADFDNDGRVDDRDLAIWQQNYGVGDGADADGDRDTDGNDFLIWQSQFGAESGNFSASRSVPEPASLTFCVVTSLCMLCSRRQ